MNADGKSGTGRRQGRIGVADGLIDAISGSKRGWNRPVDGGRMLIRSNRIHGKLLE